VRALSGRQPWWWAILHAGKRVENRRWNTHYRGSILLHAAKGCTKREWAEAVEWMRLAGVVDPASVPRIGELPRGGVVGRARIVDVCPPRDPADELGYDEGYPGLVDGRWHMREQYGFVLADVEPLPFLACDGQLGIFELPDSALDAWLT